MSCPLGGALRRNISYLHCVDGDSGNACYWYAEAGQPMPQNTLAEELERLCAMADTD
jgi:hypothetical protein